MNAPICNLTLHTLRAVTLYVWIVGAFAFVTPRSIAEDASANVDQGIAYLNGDGVPRDWNKAEELLKAGAVAGDRRAQFHLAEMYYLGEGGLTKHAAAMRWYTHAAEQGHPEAQLRLGYFSVVGHSIPRDIEVAVDWFTQAARNGEAAAQAWLGAMYANGRGVTKNEEEAVLWFRRAAEQGSAEAQCALGIMYFIGKGVTQDFVEAYIWLRLAAEQDVVPAGYTRAATAARNLTNEQLRDARLQINNRRETRD